MQHSTGKMMAAAALAVFAGRLWAGGFWLQLGNPEANTEARKAGAALVIRAVGCHDPASAQVTAKAIGMVDGKRQVIPMKLTALDQPGTYALTQQWPSQGKWVIELVGKNGEQFTNTLVSAGPSGVDRLHAKSDMKVFAQSDIEALLR